MITLITLCDLFWLLWLLPLLLGMLLTWLYWRNKYANMVSEYDGKINALNSRISGLEGDLSECGSKRAELEGDLAITKGRMRELEADMKQLKASADSNRKDKNTSSNKGNKGSNKSSSFSTDSANESDTGGIDNTGSSSLTSQTEGANSTEGDSSSSDSKSAISLKTALENDMGNNDGSINQTSNDLNKGIDLGDVASSLTGAGAANLSSSTNAGISDNDSSSTSQGSGKKSIYSGIKSDNLQIIEGIGPKMESVLKENGVNSHTELAAQTPDSLNAILGKYGDKYKIIDPTTWAQQAGYAARGDYDGMIDLQKRLDTGKDNAVGMTDSKLEKYLIKTGALKAFKQDDLKAIEGIGPATEKLLHENGIKTWRDLANTEASAVKAILTAAGSRFALGDPTTWPKQAEMAADGKFDELREYQDFLDGGRG